ncbi:MAG: GNAT family N-acetyltransferase [Thermoguttaceae bacterium]|jgi:GNAT superfamily N-acetyltransferase
MKKNGDSFRFPTVRYVKWLRMSIELCEHPGMFADLVPLPKGFVWVPWHPCLADTHGVVNYLAFRDSLDADVFPTFRSESACIALMRSIAAHSGFIPQATWLIACRCDGCTLPMLVDGQNEYRLRSRKPETEMLEYVATIQGIRTAQNVAGIQNVAVCPEFRGRGLGRALLMKALKGAHDAGIRRATLEATSGNAPALHLYETIGFHLYQTLYKEVYIS